MTLEAEVERLTREVHELRRLLDQERSQNNNHNPHNNSKELQSFSPLGASHPPPSSSSAGTITPKLQLHQLDDQWPVRTRRGKWFLKERRILSQNETPASSSASSTAGTTTELVVKLRETWTWSGRSVLLDKIVVYPVEHSPVPPEPSTATSDATNDPKNSNKPNTSDKVEDQKTYNKPQVHGNDIAPSAANATSTTTTTMPGDVPSAVISKDSVAQDNGKPTESSH